jgi:hypothetical protein
MKGKHSRFIFHKLRELENGATSGAISDDKHTAREQQCAETNIQ